MTDNFEKAKDKILKEARANGGVTTDHLLDAIGALAEDQDAQHKESMVAIRKNRDMVLEHFEEAKVRDDRIVALEEFAEESRTGCKERIERLIREEHDKRHGEHMQEYHKDGGFNERMLWFFATTFGKVMLIIIGAVAAIALNYILYGTP